MICKKNILIAPLNWGLGHAARCIPIINELLLQGFTPIIASDGDALELLQKEFPTVKSILLPSYNIRYPKNGKLVKYKLLIQLPHILKTVKREFEVVQKLVVSEKLCGIISDNRFGVRSSKVPSVFISHQLNVLSGFTTFLTSEIHQKIINKFNECWIPDDLKNNYSGKLAQSTKVNKQKFIGVLSRFKRVDQPLKYDLLVLLSGVEPSRSQLEKKIFSELKSYKGQVFFVRGKIEDQQKRVQNKNITICNFLLTSELEKVMNQSSLVLARSGYSTIMDLAVLGKKVFFIPTTGQNEQEYLAKHLEQLKVAPYATEQDFKIKMLSEAANYKGFKIENTKSNKDIDFNIFRA